MSLRPDRAPLSSALRKTQPLQDRFFPGDVSVVWWDTDCVGGLHFQVLRLTPSDRSLAEKEEGHDSDPDRLLRKRP